MRNSIVIGKRLKAASWLFALALAPPTGLAVTASAQTLPSVDLPRGIELPRDADLPRSPDLPKDALVFHGNYCGPGSRGDGLRPVDALDQACMRHDACSPARGELPTCGCNDRLRREATAVVVSRAVPQSVRDTAQIVADGALLLPCR